MDIEDEAIAEAVQSVSDLTIKIFDAIQPIVDGLDISLVTAAFSNIIQGIHTTQLVSDMHEIH